MEKCPKTLILISIALEPCSAGTLRSRPVPFGLVALPPLLPKAPLLRWLPQAQARTLLRHPLGPQQNWLRWGLPLQKPPQAALPANPLRRWPSGVPTLP